MYVLLLHLSQSKSFYVACNEYAWYILRFKSSASNTLSLKRTYMQDK